MPTNSKVLDRQTRLHEDGRIRIGHKVEGEKRDGTKYTRPAMLDKFRLTTSNRLMLEHAATIFGGEVRPWEGSPGQWELYTDRAELRVAVSASASLSQAYELWSGGGCIRRCDGEMCHFIRTEGTGKNLKVVEEGDQPCMCDRDVREAGTDPKGTCKFKTRLSVMLTELPALGRWRLESSGKMAGDEIPAILEMMADIGFDSGPVFCVLTLTQKEIKRIGQPAQNFVVPVLSLDPAPLSMAALIQSVQQSAFAPLPETQRAPALGGNSAPQLPPSTPKRTPLEGALIWLEKIGLTDDEVRDFKSWLSGQEKDILKACADARTLGALNKRELYEAIQEGVVTRDDQEGLGI